MRYKMLTKNQNRALSFFLTRALFLGGGISNIFALCGKDAWISAILGILLGIFFLYLINYCSKHLKTITKPIKILLFIFYLVLLIYNILFFSTLVSAYYLTHTPSFLICLPIVLLLIFITSKHVKCVGRIASIIFPITFFITILKVLLLTPNANFEFFLPIYTTSFSNIFISSLYYAILSTFPFVLLIEEKITFKEELTNYLIGSITTILVVVNITSIFGDTLVRIFSYPEYAILRKIEFFEFFENVENIIAFIWLCDIFMILSLTMNRLKHLLKSNKKASLCLIIISLIISLYIEKRYELVLFIYNHYIYVFALLFVLIIFSLLKMCLTRR